MYLSELYGRIGQILREHGDMEVVRQRSLKIDGIISNTTNNFVDFTSNNFGIVVDYKQNKDTFEEIQVNKHFIINII